MPQITEQELDELGRRFRQSAPAQVPREQPPAGPGEAPVV